MGWESEARRVARRLDGGPGPMPTDAASEHTARQAAVLRSAIVPSEDRRARLKAAVLREAALARSRTNRPAVQPRPDSALRAEASTTGHHAVHMVTGDGDTTVVAALERIDPERAQRIQDELASILAGLGDAPTVIVDATTE